MLIAEATATCLAVVASVCVSDTASADISPGPGWVGAVITLKDVKITSTISSDSIVTPYKKHMIKLCLKNQCIFYKGFCGKSEDEYKCLLWYSFDRMTELRNIEIRGRRDAVLSTTKHVKIVMSPAAVIPLAILNYSAQDDSPPTCNARRGCVADRRHQRGSRQPTRQR